MDKFMIDKYIEPTTMDNVAEKAQTSNKVQLVETEEPIERQHTYYEPEIIDNEIILEEVQEEPSYRFTTITIIGLILLVGYAIYYAVKTMYYKNNYLIKRNATSLDITLDELKIDVKNFIKETYEKFMDFKEIMRTKVNKYNFKQHLENGAFKANKYKAKNLLSMFM
jgi:hypothetical protein